MRKTINQLEDQIAWLKTQALITGHEIEKLKAENGAYKLVSLPITTITIALEKVTEAVAHVLADLSRRPVK